MPTAVQDPAKPTGKQAAPMLSPWPFVVGVLGTENASDYDESRVMKASVQKFPDVRIEPDGWLRGVWFDFSMVTAGNAANVAFNADAPWDAIESVLFRDTGGEQIFGPFGGYDWMCVNKFGAYQASGDPRADVNYSVTTGAAATGGSFHFSLYLPLEISSADSLGDVENRSENSIYRVELSMAASGDVYTTAPTTLGTMTVKTVQDSYTEPVADAPPSPGTLQYWKQENPLVSGGASSALITNGIGNGYRTILFKLIRSAGTRANGQADWPDPAEITLGTTRVRNLYKDTWMAKQGRAFEMTSTTPDTAHGPENGVFPLWYTQDVGIKPGDEARRRYQRTKTGNTFKIRGSFGNAGTLYITSNYVIPRGNDFSQVVA